MTSPDIPDFITEGDTREKALTMAHDCAEGLILMYLEFGEDVPASGGNAEVVPASGGNAEVATIDLDVDALAAHLKAERRVARTA